MATVRRYYVIKPTDARLSMSRRLVRAATQAEALRHVTAPLCEVEVASPDDIVDLLQAGVKPEDAGQQQSEPAANADAG
jgi:hypothetical protein